MEDVALRSAPSPFESPETSLTAFTATLPEWYADAACQNADPDIFMPSKGKPSAPAIAVCETCPVRVECLDYALTMEAEDAVYVGIWGGTTPRERRRLARLAG